MAVERASAWWFTCETCANRLRWSPSLRWRAVFEVPRLQKPLRCECRRGTAVRVVTKLKGHIRSSSDAKEHHASSAMYQLLACYFWQIRVRGTIVCAREHERRYETTPTHVMTKYWRNLIWRCVHYPPNREIKFPAKFSGHTVFTYICLYFKGQPLSW